MNLIQNIKNELKLEKHELCHMILEQGCQWSDIYSFVSLIKNHAFQKMKEEEEKAQAVEKKE